MTWIDWVSLGLMSFLYVFAGVSHFTNEKFFLKIVPPFLPQPRLMVQVSGVIEIILGVGLWISDWRSFFAWGVIALLIAVYPANIYMLWARIKGKGFRKMPVWTLWLRLALQLLLIYWAYSFT
jgi:uncharacterized membrane protein